MTTQSIIKVLNAKRINFSETISLSNLPGIYAFYFIGDDFPLLGDTVTKNQIIYIGKTESSQAKRCAKTHFTTGKTGSSTVRKSIGSILCSTGSLKPIPRNESDYTKNKFSHFKFDLQSECKITEWMKINLAISFYEYPRTKYEIKELEGKLIDEVVPILNISRNPENFFKDKLKKLRKDCALKAAENYNRKFILSTPSSNTAQQKENMMSSISHVDQVFEQKSTTQNGFTIPAIGNSITSTDVMKSRLRITAANKDFFPKESTEILIEHNQNTFRADFRYILKKSHILNLGEDLAAQIRLRPGMEIKMKVLAKNKFKIE